MPRTITGPERAAIQAGHTNVYAKLELTDPDGTWRDVSTSLDNPDWLNTVTLEEDIDGNAMTLTATLLRDSRVSGVLSLAPLRQDSTLNRDGALLYAPFLDVGRRWRVSVSVVTHGGAPSYKVIGEGLYDVVDVQDPSPTITIVGRDLGWSMLDRFIETETVYSPAGADSMQTVIQNLLNDNLTGAPTLYTPVSPAFTMNPWTQAKERLMGAISSVAALAGFVARYRYDASDVFRFTLYAPNRTATVEDWTVGPNEYTALPTARIDISGVRNKIKVQYWRDSTSQVETITASDATSIARYGGPHAIPRVLEIDMSRESNIVTNTRAQALADAILADLKDPPFLQQVDVPGFWPVQLGDYCKLLANGVHYDVDQFAAVNHITHRIENGAMKTTLQCGGKPRGRYTNWRAEGVKAEIETRAALGIPQGTVAIKADGSVDLTVDGPVWVASYRYATSTSGFPTEATVRSSGTNINGRQVSVALGAGTLNIGDTIYATIIPTSIAGYEGYEGPSIKLRGTRHDFSSTKTVHLAAASLAPFYAYLAGSTKWEVVNGAISNRNYAPATDGSNVLTFSSMVIVPDGVTLTAASFDVYDAAGADNMYIQAAFDRIDASGGYTRLVGVLSSSGVGWETLSGSMSESTSGKKYRVIFVLSNTNSAAVTDGITKVSTISYTYTMPSSDKAI